MPDQMDETTRRTFIASLVATGAAAGFASRTARAAGATDAGTAPGSPGEAGEVAPAEDLMREHGVLNRILLICDEGLRRLDAGARDAATRRSLSSQLRTFNRMYRPHEAREDKEHELFGARGFKTIVDEVAGLERKLAIYDLAQFTPR